MNSIRRNSTILSKSERLKHFIKDVGLPLSEAPQALGVRPSEFMAWWSGQGSRLIRKDHFISIGQYLNINEDEILEGNYNREFIRSILFSEEICIPEKYQKNQFSFLRSSAHILKYITLTRGQHFSDMIMRKLNLSPIIYTDLNSKISLNYFIDLLDLLAQNGLNQNELDSLACVMFLSLSETPLGFEFKKAKTHYECYRILSESAQLFDSNFIYKFDLDPNQVVITAELPFDLHEHMDLSENRTKKLLRYRQLLMGWFPYLSKLPPILPKTENVFTSSGITTTYKISFLPYQSTRLFALSGKSGLAP